MKKTTIGGQAVIEGVMMKNYDKYAVAVRKPDQKIEVKVQNYTAAGDKVKILKIPFIRGIFNFLESMVLGVKTLNYSAEFFEEEEDTPKEKKKEKQKSAKAQKREESFMTGLTIFISLAMVICIFMLLPAFLTGLLQRVITNHVVLTIIEGILRIAIFVLYIVLISQMKDIKRTFMYHGAEHKTINCLEAGDALTPENVKKHSRYHKRCGTSFMFVVMLISIVVFMFIHVEGTWLRMLYRLLLVPVIAGISYEFIRFAGKNDSIIMRILSIPGMWLQRLTTKEPDLDMIEVAIASVEGVLDWRQYIKELNNGELED